MATKPTKSTEWASDASALKIDPSADQQSYGWSTSDNTVSGVPVKPNLQNQNAWQNAVHQWKEYFEDITDDSLKWHEATASATLTAASPRKWYVQGQTSEIVLTIDGTDIKKGDLFKFKNNGSLDPSQNDLHLLHVKTQDASKSIIVWLLKGDSCVIKALKDNPTVTEDWDFISLDRPNGLIDALTFSNYEIPSTTIASTQYIRDVIWVDKYACFFFIHGGLIFKSDQYGKNISVVDDLGFQDFRLIKYIPENDVFIISGYDNVYNEAIIFKSDDSTTWTKVNGVGMSGTVTATGIHYLPDIDRIVVPFSTDTGVDNFYFYFSDDQGATWTESAYFLSDYCRRTFYNKKTGLIQLFNDDMSTLYSNDGSTFLTSVPNTISLFDEKNDDLSRNTIFHIAFNDESNQFIMVLYNSTETRFEYFYSVDGLWFFRNLSVSDNGNYSQWSYLTKQFINVNDNTLSFDNYWEIKLNQVHGNLSNLRPSFHNVASYIDLLMGIGFVMAFAGSYSKRMNRIFWVFETNTNLNQVLISGRR